MRILIADPCNISRLGIRSIVSQTFDCVASEAANVDELFMALGQRFDVLTLDPMLCECSTAGLLEEIFQKAPYVSLLVITDLDAKRYGLEAYHSEAMGFLTKHCTAEELSYAIHRAILKKPYIADEIIERLAANTNHRQLPPSFDSLTEREADIFALIVRGTKITEIGKILGISPKTASTHKARIMFKLNFDNVASLCRYAINQNLTNQFQIRSSRLIDSACAVNSHST